MSVTQDPRPDAAAVSTEAAPEIQPFLTPGSQPSYEELLHFFNESSDLLCIADFGGNFKRLNPAWLRALGWTLAELQARSFLDFVHPDDRPATLEVMRQLDSGKPTFTFENRYHCLDGSWKWLQWSATPFPGQQEIYAIARDVTRRKHLEREVLETLDLERERIGRELHDGLCQDLAGTAALCGSLARRLAPAAEPESAAAREIGELIGESIRHARDLARASDPLNLETIGLQAALENFCSRTGTQFEIVCNLHCFPCPPRLGMKRETHLYRIVQEAVNNALTHGRAKVIGVSLAYQNGRGVLSIEDDGIGIDDLHRARMGMGLRSMAYRASLIGASIELDRRASRGTTVSCVFSLLSATSES